tara:strand:- start:1186 stop:1785 length:600 start_codon:yes stop_codon:yes gene_type:complete
MAITLNGSTNTVAGLAVGGLPDGIVDNDMIANTTIAEGKLAANVNTIAEADQWRITADVTSGSTILTSNWERCDTHFDKVGTGMSESSGVFSFPQTGIWLIMFNSNARYDDYQRRYVGANIQVTVNDSSYATIVDAYNAFPASSGSPAYASVALTALFDVTNVSNCKVKVQVTADGSVVWLSGSAISYNHFTFIRLGDT